MCTPHILEVHFPLKLPSWYATMLLYTPREDTSLCDTPEDLNLFDIVLNCNYNRLEDEQNYDLQQWKRPRRLSNLAGVQLLRLVRAVRRGSSMNHRSSTASVSLYLGQLWLPDICGATTLWHQHISLRRRAQTFTPDKTSNLSWRMQTCESTIPTYNKLTVIVNLY